MSNDRDNESRLGLGDSLNAPPETVPTPKASLDFVMPTEHVELPSEGRFYPPNHTLRNRKDIEIKYMTAKEEDILTSRNLLKKGTAIDKLVENIILDKSIKVEDLIMGDKNAIILAARKTGYGSRYDCQIQCPACDAKVRFGFDLDKVQNKKIEDVEGVTQTENGTFLLTLPRLKVEVEIKPMTGRDEKILTDALEQKKKEGLQEANQTTQMKVFIKSINGETDKKIIQPFIERIPASDAKFLREVYKKLIPDIDMAQTFSCKECGHEEVVEIPLTTDFFWPK